MWVKVSGSDRISRQGPPYADAVPYARSLVERFGDRTLWGTDWPHPNQNHVPDDGVLVDLLGEITPSAREQQMLLVENPQRLYRFPVLLESDEDGKFAGVSIFKPRHGKASPVKKSRRGRSIRSRSEAPR